MRKGGFEGFAGFFPHAKGYDQMGIHGTEGTEADLMDAVGVRLPIERRTASYEISWTPSANEVPF